MSQKHPQLLPKTTRGNSISWEGDWHPALLSDVYRIRVTYVSPSRPIISVVTPKLKLAEGAKKLPHVHKGGQADICVHQPSEWNANMIIADTIMPWISQWLYFYEVWAQTGHWEGKGTHPDSPEHR
jgi:hypothetical protein